MKRDPDRPPAIVQLSEVEGLSVRELEEAVRAAIRDQYPQKSAWTWIAELYDDRVIFEHNPRAKDGEERGPVRFLEATYTINREGIISAELGKVVEVKRVVRYEPLSASEAQEEADLGDVVELVEADKAGTVDLKIISPGWGSSGYYSPDVLKEDGPRAFPKGTHMYFDHPTATEARERPERSLRDLAAVTETDPVYQENGPAGPGLYAKARVQPQFTGAIKALAEHIGVSIRAAGQFKEGEVDGRRGRVVTKIAESPTNSVDFVTKAGRGGQVLAIMESLRQNGPDAVSPSAAMSSNAQTTASASEAISLGYGSQTGTYVQETGTAVNPGGTITLPSTVITTGPVTAPAVPVQEADNMELKEAQDRIGVLEGQLTEANQTIVAERERGDRAEGALAILEAKHQAGKLLENVELPKAAKLRVIERAADGATLKDGKLDMDALKESVESVAKIEAEYLESLGVVGKVTDQGTRPGAAQNDPALEEALASELGPIFNMSPEVAKLAAAGRNGR